MDGTQTWQRTTTQSARTQSEARVALIAGSIREYGFTDPAIVDGQNGII